MWRVTIISRDGRVLGESTRAAEEISSTLSLPDKGPLKRWLRVTAGSLQVKDRSVIEAIRDLNLSIATTNYDGLLEEVTGFPPVTWLDCDRVIRVIRRQEPGIIHFHGHWREPESVVLGTSSYERILGHPHAQEVLRSLMTLQCLVFVGCGDGLSDPNFGQLLRWAKGVFADTETQHYRLCRQGEYDGLRARHGEDHLHPISYGSGHSSLEPFLRTLGSFASGGNGSEAGSVPLRPLRLAGEGRGGGLLRALKTPPPLSSPPRPSAGPWRGRPLPAS